MCPRYRQSFPHGLTRHLFEQCQNSEEFRRNADAMEARAGRPGTQPSRCDKPLMSIANQGRLAAAARRCRELKHAGQPCHEFDHNGAQMPRGIQWSCGVTTCTQRLRDGLLKGTLKSLREAGFDWPRLFMDGVSPGDWALGSDELDQLPVTLRWPAVRPWANWWLGLAELFAREPNADRYAMFQDDFVCVKNLRAYLTACPYPDPTESERLKSIEEERLPRDGAYWNLYSFSNTNEPLIDAALRDGRAGQWIEGGLLNPEASDPRLLQCGRGAVALVLSNQAVKVLLQSRHAVERPSDPDGWRRIDGGVVTAMNKAGWRELIHCPSLVQHVGLASAMGNKQHAQARSFPGEEFDALAWLPKNSVAV